VFEAVFDFFNRLRLSSKRFARKHRMLFKVLLFIFASFNLFTGYSMAKVANKGLLSASDYFLENPFAPAQSATQGNVAMFTSLPLMSITWLISMMFTILAFYVFSVVFTPSFEERVKEVLADIEEGEI